VARFAERVERVPCFYDLLLSIDTHDRRGEEEFPFLNPLMAESPSYQQISWVAMPDSKPEFGSGTTAQSSSFTNGFWVCMASPFHFLGCGPGPTTRGQGNFDEFYRISTSHRVKVAVV